MPTFVSVSEEILDDRNGCNTQKNPLEINKTKSILQHYNASFLNTSYRDAGTVIRQGSPLFNSNAFKMLPGR